MFEFTHVVQMLVKFTQNADIALLVLRNSGSFTDIAKVVGLFFMRSVNYIGGLIYTFKHLCSVLANWLLS